MDMPLPNAPLLVPVLLCGGEGRRLAPLSTPDHPKPVLPLLPGGATLLGETLRRARLLAPPARIVTLAGQASAQHVRRLLAAEGADRHLLIESAPRNTAAAAALAALYARERWPGALLAVLPADHYISNNEAFARQVREAAPFAQSGHIVLFAVPARGADERFGHMVLRCETVTEGPFYGVERFVEKPPAHISAEMIRAGRCYWNSGIFLFSADTLLGELRQHAPDLLAACEAIAPTEGLLETSRLPACLPSLDTLVLEATSRLVAAPARFDWRDMGSWEELAALSRESGKPLAVSRRWLADWGHPLHGMAENGAFPGVVLVDEG